MSNEKIALDKIRDHLAGDAGNFTMYKRHFVIEDCSYMTFPLRGRDLHCATQIDGEAFSPRDIYHMFSQIVECYAIAHAAGVFHNDSKLDNILRMDPTSKNVSPTDFGKATFGDMDTPLEVVCNTIYKSPELLLGLDTASAAAADVYTLGSLAAELLLDRRLHTEHLAPLIQLTAMVRRHGEMESEYLAKAIRAKPDFFAGGELKPLRRREQGQIKDVCTLELSLKPLHLPQHFKSVIFGFLEWDPEYRMTAEQGKDILARPYRDPDNQDDDDSHSDSGSGSDSDSDADSQSHSDDLRNRPPSPLTLQLEADDDVDYFHAHFVSLPEIERDPDDGEGGGDERPASAADVSLVRQSYSEGDYGLESGVGNARVNTVEGVEPSLSPLFGGESDQEDAEAGKDSDAAFFTTGFEVAPGTSSLDLNSASAEDS